MFHDPVKLNTSNYILKRILMFWQISSSPILYNTLDIVQNVLSGFDTFASRNYTSIYRTHLLFIESQSQAGHNRDNDLSKRFELKKYEITIIDDIYAKFTEN